MKIKHLRRLASSSLALVMTVSIWAAILGAAWPLSVEAATVSISSPSQGQEFSGNDFTVSGQTDANATVLIMRNNAVLKYTRADGDGKWSVMLTDLPDGSNTITAKVLKNTGYGYYVSTPDPNGSEIKLNRFQLSDNAITNNGTYPLTLTKTNAGIVMSPVGTKFVLSVDLSQVDAPDIFDAANPITPIEVDNYPANAGTNFGGFSLDGTKYFSPNDSLHTVSVVDIASHTVADNIDLGESPVTAWSSPAGPIYVSSKASFSIPKIHIINTATNAISSSFNSACTAEQSVTSLTFAADSDYPYYYAYCLGGSSPKVLKYKITDNSLVSQFTIPDFSPTSGALNIDGSRLYVSMSALAGVDPTANQIHVLDTATGQDLKTITASAGVIGFMPSPDLQRLYVATPNGDFSASGFDVLDMFTDEMTHVATGGEIVPIVGVPISGLQTANVNLSVVLGVKTASSNNTLAKTGVATISAVAVGVILAGVLLYTYLDYRKHRRPLIEADPHANQTYTFPHHLAAVTIPLLRYRLRISLHRAPSGISKF
jgi:hypothetical protein